VDKVLTQIWLQVRQIVTSRTKACEARRLRVQTDNAGSENKNFYMIGLLALLVHWNWFDQVLHAFLQQGHTHTLDDSTNFASNPALKKAQLFDLLTVVNESHSKRVPDPSDPSGHKRGANRWLSCCCKRCLAGRPSSPISSSPCVASKSFLLIQRDKATGKIAFWYAAFDSDPNCWHSAQRGCPDLSRSAPG